MVVKEDFSNIKDGAKKEMKDEPRTDPVLQEERRISAKCNDKETVCERSQASVAGAQSIGRWNQRQSGDRSP